MIQARSVFVLERLEVWHSLATSKPLQMELSIGRFQRLQLFVAKHLYIYLNY